MTDDNHFTPKPERILRIWQVKERTNLSTATIYRQMKQGMFPKAMALGIRASGWRESDIIAWQASLTQK